ncbi:MAG: hypothetical protein D6719_00740 [Candidatus Dadabacteria bacterium]|nr:MAG: hypothetical protein D6719_00740 [Candidatus Dadabacteria bacterium]
MNFKDLYDYWPLIAVGVVLILFAAPAVIKAVISSSNKERQKMRETASMLGLEWHDWGNSLDELVSSDAHYQQFLEDLQAILPGMNLNQPPSPEKLRKILANPLTRKLALSALPWKMKGKYNGIPVTITPVSRGSGENKKTYIRFSALFEKELSFQVNIAREKFADKLTKTIKGVRDIQTGDPEFDRLFFIKGDREAEIKTWLNSQRREVLTEALSACDSCFFNSKGLHQEVSSIKTDYTLYKEQLDSITKMLSLLN